MENEDFQNKFSGKFIVLDGPDGCGKSTQTQLLTEWLQKQDVPAVSFRDPGDTAIGEKIRKILLSPEHDAMDTRTELLFYMASRPQRWCDRKEHAVRQNRCVALGIWHYDTCA